MAERSPEAVTMAERSPEAVTVGERSPDAVTIGEPVAGLVTIGGPPVSVNRHVQAGRSACVAFRRGGRFGKEPPTRTMARSARLS
ncbi:hypothetical protein AB0K93_36765, partial [Streptomyces sp. NPDC052676]|uniref:hypothetical protein n=1 Tax=Streptomyces sp. NPDC052676 TaxID=3154953 RepID=UPI00342ABF15